MFFDGGRRRCRWTLAVAEGHRTKLPLQSKRFRSHIVCNCAERKRAHRDPAVETNEIGAYRHPRSSGETRSTVSAMVAAWPPRPSPRQAAESISCTRVWAREASAVLPRSSRDRE